MNLATVDLAQRGTTRLISTGRLREAVLRALAPNYGMQEDLAKLESVTNGRLRAQRAGLPDLAPEELAFGQVGHTLINAAFTHTRPGGNRFNGDGRGAWYCAFDAETALAEVGYHLTRALEDAGRFENITDYGELRADFIGPFHDLRGLSPPPACLDPDPAIGYPAGQALAEGLRAGDGNGLVYPSTRRPAGTCLVAFRPSLVQNVRQGTIWRLEWQGTREPAITENPHQQAHPMETVAGLVMDGPSVAPVRAIRQS